MALADEYGIDVQVLETDLGLWVSPVRPEWGVELQTRKIDHMLDSAHPEKYIPWGEHNMGENRERDRGRQKRSVSEGREVMQMGSQKGRAPAAGEPDPDGNVRFDVDAARVLVSQSPSTGLSLVQRTAALTGLFVLSLRRGGEIRSCLSALPKHVGIGSSSSRPNGSRRSRWRCE